MFSMSTVRSSILITLWGTSCFWFPPTTTTWAGEVHLSHLLDWWYIKQPDPAACLFQKVDADVEMKDEGVNHLLSETEDCWTWQNTLREKLNQKQVWVNKWVLFVVFRTGPFEVSADLEESMEFVEPEAAGLAEESGDEAVTDEETDLGTDWETVPSPRFCDIPSQVETPGSRQKLLSDWDQTPDS